MGGSGDPLADCQDFNALLIATTEALTTLLPLLRAQEEGLTGLEPDLREGLRGAQGAAEALDHELAPSGGGAVTALRELGSGASGLRESAAALETAAGQAEESAGHDLDQAGERLHAAFEELVSAPFAALEHDLVEEQAEFAQAATDSEEALTTLSSAFTAAIAGINVDVESSLTSLEQVEDAVDDLKDDVVGVSPDGTLTASFVLQHAVPDALDETVTSRIESMKNALQAWEQRLDTEAALLQSTVDSLVEAGAASVVQCLQPPRDALAAAQGEWGRAELEAEQTAADLEGAAPGLETAAALASRIGEMQQQIEWIQQVIAAMDTK